MNADDAYSPCPIPRPLPGQHVLACRCGTALSLRDMHRQRPLLPRSADCMTVAPIVCVACAVTS